MAADLASGTSVAHTSRTAHLDHAANIGGPIRAQDELLSCLGPIGRGSTSGNCGRTPTASCPTTRARRNEGFGKVTYTPVGDVLINSDLRDLEREETSDLFGEIIGGGHRHRKRSAPADRDRGSVVGDRLAQPSLGAVSAVRSSRRWADPTSSPKRTVDTDDRHADRSERARQDGPFPGPDARGRPDAPRRTPSCSRCIDRYGYVGRRNGARVGRRHLSATEASSTTSISIRTEAKVGYNVTVGGEHSGTICTPDTVEYTDQEDLCRTSKGWGLFSRTCRHRPRPTEQFRCSARGRGVSTAGQQASLPRSGSRLPVAELEINDAIHWNRFTFNLGLIGEQRHDVRPGVPRRRVQAFHRIRSAAPGVNYEMLDMAVRAR